MKKIGMYSIKIIVMLAVFLILTIILYHSLGFLYVIEKSLLFTVAAVVADFVFVIVKKIMKRWKKSK